PLPAPALSAHRHKLKPIRGAPAPVGGDVLELLRCRRRPRYAPRRAAHPAVRVRALARERRSALRRGFSCLQAVFHPPSFRPRFLFKHIPLHVIEFPRMRPCRTDRETAMTILRPDPGCQETLGHLIGIVGKYHGGGCVAPVPPTDEGRRPSKSIGSNKLPERQLIANSNVVSVSHRELHE